MQDQNTGLTLSLQAKALPLSYRALAASFALHTYMHVPVPTYACCMNEYNALAL